MAAQRGLRVVCAREIQKSLRDSVKQLIEDKIRSLGLSGVFDVLDTEIRHKSNGSRFVFIGMWRNPDAVKSLEGADIFWGEEASAFSDRSIKIIRPTMRKPGSELWFSWNPEFDHDPVDKLFRGEHGPPPDSLVVEVSWRDNPWFDKSPLKAEMEFDYQSDPAKAEHVWGGGYVTAIDGAYYASIQSGEGAGRGPDRLCSDRSARSEAGDLGPWRFGLDGDLDQSVGGSGNPGHRLHRGPGSAAGLLHQRIEVTRARRCVVHPPA